MSEPYVITIILNTNRRQDTLECLESLKKGTYPNHKIIVLDNASTDGSVEAIEADFPDVQIMNLTSNLGYAGNNNVGIKEAISQQADWIFVLNEDTILDPACISELINVAQSDEKIGIVGPMVYHHNEPTIIQSAGGSLGSNWDSIHIAQNEPDTGQFPKARPVDWISGCAILVKRAAIEDVGMLDERFFYYWEETEWCLRTGKAGWQVFHVPQAKLWHKGVQRDYKPKPSVTYYSTRNRLLMLKKHQAPIKIKASVWFEYIRRILAWTIKPKWASMRGHRDAMVIAIKDYWGQRWGKGPL